MGCSPAASCTASSLLRALLRALLLRPPPQPVLLLLLLAMMVCSVARAASSCPLMTSHRGDSGRETSDTNRNTPRGQQARQIPKALMKVKVGTCSSKLTRQCIQT